MDENNQQVDDSATEEPVTSEAEVQAAPSSIRHSMLKAGAMLALFALLGTELVSFTYQSTAQQIAENQRAVLLRSLNDLIPEALHDNDLLADTLAIRNAGLLGSQHPVTIYRAYLRGQPTALAFMPTAPNGYGGPIKLLVALRTDGTLLGVRVIEHQETPGLGDAIEVQRSPWVLGFEGRSLINPEESQWQVKRDGGVFDQFTGATITPRAVVQAVYKSLMFYKTSQDELWQTDPGV